MARFALINTSNSSIIEFREYASQPPNPSGKARKWLPVTAGTPPTVDQTVEVATAPTYAVNANDVTETLGKRNLTAQEISDAKDTAIANINGTWQVIKKTVLTLENEIRDLRSKLNAEVVASGRSAPFTAGQSSSITMAQLINAVKAAL